MKVYLASSWRNMSQPDVLKALRAAGFETYDFRNPGPGQSGFGWRSVDDRWEHWTPAEYREGLKHPVAAAGWASDQAAMDWADVGVYLLPCGRSASIEAGYMAGQRKPVFTLMLGKMEPELMVLTLGPADNICFDVDELIARIRAVPPRVRGEVSGVGRPSDEDFAVEVELAAGCGRYDHSTYADKLLGSTARRARHAEAAIRRHRDYRGDARCFGDDDELYACLPEGYDVRDLALHTPEEMLPNCRRYLESRQPGGVPYVSPNDLIVAQRARIAELEAGLGGELNDLLELDRLRGQVGKLQQALLESDAENQRLTYAALQRAGLAPTDVHAPLAESILKADPSLTAKQARDEAKAVNFGALYGRGPDGGDPAALLHADSRAAAPADLGRELLDSVIQENRELKGHVERLQKWVSDLQAGASVCCVYCGHNYGPRESTPVAMADVLKAHVEQCPAHPMSALRRENEELHVQLAALRREADGL